MNDDLFPGSKPEFAKSVLIKEIDREIGMREVVYGKYVRNGNMRRKTMDDRIAMMRQVRDIVAGHNGSE